MRCFVLRKFGITSPCGQCEQPKKCREQSWLFRKNQKKAVKMRNGQDRSLHFTLKFLRFVRLLTLLIMGWGVYRKGNHLPMSILVSVPLRSECFNNMNEMMDKMMVSVPLRGFDFTTVFYHISTIISIKKRWETGIFYLYYILSFRFRTFRQ